MSTAASRHRGQAAPERVTVATAAMALGAALVARSERGICAVLLGDDPAALLGDVSARFPGAHIQAAGAAADAEMERVFAAVASPAGIVDVRLDLRGTAFQQTVWAALREIPPGQTSSYREVAARIGRPAAVRAVAAACAANPVAVLVPCHRVVRSDGGLSGYRWGVDRKRALLARERAHAGASALSAAPAAPAAPAPTRPRTVTRVRAGAGAER